MTTPVSVAEADIRRRLDAALDRVRAGLAGCPPVDDLAYVDVAAAAAAADAAAGALTDATACIAELDKLTQASEEAAVIVASSRIGLAVVREVLTVLTAAIDSQLAA
jgi:hypothetical protein